MENFNFHNRFADWFHIREGNSFDGLKHLFQSIIFTASGVLLLKLYPQVRSKVHESVRRHVNLQQEHKEESRLPRAGNQNWNLRGYTETSRNFKGGELRKLNLFVSLFRFSYSRKIWKPTRHWQIERLTSAISTRSLTRMSFSTRWWFICLITWNLQCVAHSRR